MNRPFNPGQQQIMRARLRYGRIAEVENLSDPVWEALGAASRHITEAEGTDDFVVIGRHISAAWAWLDAAETAHVAAMTRARAFQHTGTIGAAVSL